MNLPVQEAAGLKFGDRVRSTTTVVNVNAICSRNFIHLIAAVAVGLSLLSPRLAAEGCAFGLQELFAPVHPQRALIEAAAKKLQEVCTACVDGNDRGKFLVVYETGNGPHRILGEVVNVRTKDVAGADKPELTFLIRSPQEREDHAITTTAVKEEQLRFVYTVGTKVSIALKTKNAGGEPEIVEGTVTRISGENLTILEANGNARKISIFGSGVDWKATLDRHLGKPPQVERVKRPEADPAPPGNRPEMDNRQKGLVALVPGKFIAPDAKPEEPAFKAPIKSAEENWGSLWSTDTQRRSEWPYHYPSDGERSLVLKVDPPGKDGKSSDPLTEAKILEMFLPRNIEKDMLKMEGLVLTGIFIIDRRGSFRLASEDAVYVSGRQHNPPSKGAPNGRNVVKHGDLAPMQLKKPGWELVVSELAKMEFGGEFLLSKEEQNGLLKVERYSANSIEAAARTILGAERAEIFLRGMTSPEIVTKLFRKTSENPDPKANPYLEYVEGGGTYRGYAYIGGEVVITFKNGVMNIQFNINSSYSFRGIGETDNTPQRYTKAAMDKLMAYVRPLFKECIQTSVSYPAE